VFDCFYDRREEDHDCNLIRRLELSRAASLRRVQSSDVFECPFCDLRFLDSPSLSAHVDEIHQEGKGGGGNEEEEMILPSSSTHLEPCPFCGGNFSTELLLTEHINSLHT